MLHARTVLSNQIPFDKPFSGGSRIFSDGGANPRGRPLTYCYCPQRSYGKVIFSQACVKNSVHGGCLPQCMLGYTPQEQTPGSRHPPPAADTPLGPDPPQDQTPRSRHHPPPGKQTAAYGQRAAGTHPTGMHSCLLCGDPKMKTRLLDI